MPSLTLYDLFLSYAWGRGGHRRAFARFLVAFLRAAGYTVWFDEDHMAPGAAAQGGTDGAMAAGILHSSAMVVLLSPDYAVSENCKKESDFADNQKKPRFFVNVEANYVPHRFDKANPPETGGWLSLVVGKALWADGSGGEGAWVAPGGGGATLLSALGGDARVRRTGPPPAAPVRRLQLAELAASAGGFSAAARIGEGATGEVFRGTFEGAPVAIKVLKLPTTATPEARAALRRRFRAELDTLGAVQHRRIVHLLAYGEDNAPAAKAPFALVFELLEEGSLGDWLCGPDGAPPVRGAALSPAERVEALAGAATGLYHLHGLAPPIMHRDVKSANIGLTRMSGALFSKLFDCGLAKALKAAPPDSPAAAGASFTGGLAVGTLGYMAPELTSGAYSARSEVYALGVVLLEVLTGRRVGPNTAREVEKAARKGGIGSVVARADAAWPREAAEKAAEFLTRCIATDEEDRPESVEEVVAALAEVRALLPSSTAARGGAADAAAWARAAEAARAREAGAAREREVEAEAVPARIALRYTGGPLRAHCVAKLNQGDDSVSDLAVVDGVGLVSCGSNHIRTWGPRADRGLRNIAGLFSGISALPGGRIATGSEEEDRDTLVEVWDAGTAQRLHQLDGHADTVWSTAALPGGLLASGSSDATVRIWNAATGAHVATLKGHLEQVHALAVFPDGKLASGSLDNTVRLWNVAARACTKTLQHEEGVATLAVLNGGRFASGCYDSKIYIWSSANGVQEAVLTGHTDSVLSLAALPNGLLASGSADKTVRVWDVGARACVAVLEGHGGTVYGLAALTDGRLASGSWNDPLIRVWALTTPGSLEDAGAAAAALRSAMVPFFGQLNGHCVATLMHGDAAGVLALATVEGVGLVSGGTSRIRAWAQGADRGLKNAAGKAHGIAALPGGRFATAGHDAKLVEVWDGASCRCLHQLRHTAVVRCVAALPGGLLASGSNDNTVLIWNATTGAHVATLEGHSKWVYALAALPDGRLASGGDDQTVFVWNVAKRTFTLVLRHSSGVRALAILDGGRLASGCDETIYIWSTAGGAKEAVLEGHDRFVDSLAALPRGLLASGSRDETVRVWDLVTRACLAVLKGHRGVVYALAALPDGRLASGAYDDPLIRVWALAAPGSPEDAAATAAAARFLTIEPAAESREEVAAAAAEERRRAAEREAADRAAAEAEEWRRAAELERQRAVQREAARAREAREARSALFAQDLVERTGGLGPKAEREAALRARGGDYEAACGRAAADGAIPVLIAALESNAENAAVCTFACAALRNLAGANDMVARAVAEAGSVPPLVAALKRHAHVEAVCAPACGALQNIAFFPDLRARIVAVGGVPALAAAAMAHPGARKVAAAALERLQKA